MDEVYFGFANILDHILQRFGFIFVLVKNVKLNAIAHMLVAGMTIGYGRDGPGIESRWGGMFRTRPDRPWGLPSLLYNAYRVFPGSKVAGGVAFTTHPHQSSKVNLLATEFFFFFSNFSTSCI